MKRRILAFMLVMMFVLLPAITAFAEKYATVTADVLNLRAAPQGEKVGRVRYGTRLKVLSDADSNNYYLVEYNGKRYYVFGKYLDFGNSQPTTQQRQSRSSTRRTVKTVTCNIFFCDIGTDECECKGLMFVKSARRLALRRRADLDSRLIRWLEHGEPVIILDEKISHNFVKVRTMDGLEGYAYVSYLSADMIEDVTYAVEVCENYGCCEDHICWTSVSW